MKILVTGATGFIGSHLVPRLARRHEVVTLEEDLREPLTYDERIDAVVHLAQSRRYRDPEGADDVEAVNVDGTARVLELARRGGARVFVLASSGSVYAPSAQPLREDDPVAPAGAYSSSKLAAEALLEGCVDAFSTAGLRFFAVYGPGQREMLVADLIDRVCAGRPVTVRNRRVSPTYVEDAVSAIEAALHVEGQVVVNVAGDEEVTIAELVAAIERATGVTAVLETVDDEPTALIASNERMKALLGVMPEWTLERGLAATFAARGR